MNSSVSLGGEDLERLWRTIDASIKVTQRCQFFLWVQGSLQSFLPHETLVCCMGDPVSLKGHHSVFSRLVIDPAVEARLADPDTSIVPRLFKAWSKHQRRPLCYAAESCPEGLSAHFGRHHTLCHGVNESIGDCGSLFAFLGLPAPPREREAYIVDLLMPHIHLAFQRVCNHEQRKASARGPEPILSEREIEVLGWMRDGKTNLEIGAILGISPLTVKNHVQRMLRRLNVANRTQAVARAVAAGLLAHPGDGESAPARFSRRS